MIGLAFFVYKRPECTQRVIESIKKNNFEKLYIFQDGLKDEKDREQWEEVSAMVRAIEFADTEIHISDRNKGLANSIIEGMDYVFERHDTAIALEDDALLSEDYKDFMSACFSRYESDRKVMGISGGNHVDVAEDYPYDVCYLYRMSSLGFGTWKDRWTGFDRDPRILTRILKDKEKNGMLELAGDLVHYVTDSVQNRSDTWATYWALYQIDSGCYHIAPKRNLATDIGRRGNGTNSTTATHRYEVPLYTKKGEWKFPQDIYLDERITEDVRRLYSSGSAEKRYKNYNDILSKWLGLKINGYSLATYFIEKKINEIYIYGTADIAGHLYDDVHEEITIKAFIVESKTMKTFRGLEVYDMGDDVELDGIPIIITPSHASGVIQYVFERNRVTNPIIPINDIVDYVSEKYER
ncbi:phospholipase C/P1 nuclease family protein [Acetatifactor aquisgranensis]|uniref:hypothetical protein n=1 Tax=Acetatifactor aquisgranensis TaxID=2941233 RepID=UPI00203BE58A|nr:hypothetical protein [Acetatifactor aquisgranensis]